MFDLEKAIQDWKLALLQTESVSQENSLELLAALCVTMVAGRGIALLGANFHTRVIEVSEFGEYVRWSYFGGMAVGFCIVVGCLGMILAIRDKSVETTSVIE